MMTQRERIREERVGVYDTPSRTADDHDYKVVEATDQVRWGPVIAGIFTTVTSLLGLAVLGLAIGLSAFDSGDPLGAFGIGAGIWGLVSGLIAFGLGGYMAGATARNRGGDRGLLNGAMVWIVTIPLTMMLLGSGLTSLFNTATNSAGAVGQAAGAAVGAAADNPAAQATAQAAGQAVQDAAGNVQPPPPGQVNQAADVGGRTVWGTLLWLGLSAGAAMAGGFMGGKVNETGRRTVARAR